MRRGEAGPAFYELAVGDLPDYDAGEFVASSGPAVAHDYFVVFGDAVTLRRDIQRAESRPVGGGRLIAGPT